MRNGLDSVISRLALVARVFEHGNGPSCYVRDGQYLDFSNGSLRRTLVREVRVNCN
jgi:hypothetical protein